MVRVVIPTHHQKRSRSGQPYVVYSVEIYSNGKCHKMSRRYRDFHSLHKELRKVMVTPDFPPKKVRNLNQKLIEQRREALERYLQGVLRMDSMPKPMADFLCLPEQVMSDRKELTGSGSHSWEDEDEGSCSVLSHQPLIGFNSEWINGKGADGSSPGHSVASSSSSLPDIVIRGALEGFYSLEDDFYAK